VEKKRNWNLKEEKLELKRGGTGTPAEEVACHKTSHSVNSLIN
jgi:hypothetical protein